MRKTRFYFGVIIASLISAVFLTMECLAAPAAKAPDTEPPSVPAGLSAVNRTYTSISLTWSRPDDNIGVRGYQIYRDGKKIITTTKTSYTNDYLIPGREYAYSVRAYDAAGNTSQSSSLLSVATLLDSQCPTIPGTPVVSSSTHVSITLAWKPSTDNTSVKGYELFRNGSRVTSTSATSYVCKSLTPGKTYTFTVKAYDIAGNYSTQSGSISAATIPDTAAPSIPSGLKAASVSETQVNLTWQPSSDNVKVSAYEIFLDGKRLGSTTKTSYSSKRLIPGTNYTYTVKAADIVNNSSDCSDQLKVTTMKDLKPPTAPTGLKVNSINGSSISLIWNASTDNVKVKGYYVYCSGIKVATATRTHCTVKSPLRLGIDVFWVKAYDLSGNVSDSSATVVAIS